MPKKEWVKTLKEQVEVRFYSIRASLGWLEAGEKDMEVVEQAKLGFVLAIGESERLNARLEESDEEARKKNKRIEQGEEKIEEI